MAKQANGTTAKMATPKKKRKGVHSKKKASSAKNAKNYTKKYVGQG